MVSKSCILFVKDALDKLDLTPISVGLGEIEMKNDLSQEQMRKLNSKIEKAALQLIEKKHDRIVEKIKHVIIDYVYNINDQPNINFSDLLSKKLGYNYNYLANLFQKVKGITIQQYFIRIKIERVKELILLDELTLTEIAYKLQYSSVAHLSNQFKKVTGLCPSEFKKLIESGKESRRLTIQEV